MEALQLKSYREVQLIAKDRGVRPLKTSKQSLIEAIVADVGSNNPPPTLSSKPLPVKSEHRRVNGEGGGGPASKAADATDATASFLTNAIISAAVSPSSMHHRILRVTAGAGTGKTTTLVHYAHKLVASGYKSIKYLTFNTDGAAEAQNRFKSHGKAVQCSTIHSAAFNCVGIKSVQMKDDSELDEWIKEQCLENVQNFLSNISRDHPERNRVSTLILVYIRKTLMNFIQGSYIDMNPNTDVS